MMAMFNGDEVAVVIDNGSALIKAGMSDRKSPTAVFPTVVGYPKREVRTDSIFSHNIAIGEKNR
jgi:actin-related protein